MLNTYEWVFNERAVSRVTITSSKETAKKMAKGNDGYHLYYPEVSDVDAEIPDSEVYLLLSETKSTII